MPQRKDIPIGTKFGFLTVVGPVKILKGKSESKVICKCGKIKEIQNNDLKKGNYISCGCSTNVKHGMSRTPEYYAWQSMKERCLDKNNKSFKHYGGRGIKVDEVFLKENGYDIFYKLLGKKPSKKHSLDRYPDNDGNYKPGNLRWATKKEQAENRRTWGEIKLRGVYKKKNRFVAQISFEGKQYYIGHFKNPKLASLAYESCKAVLMSSSPATNEA